MKHSRTRFRIPSRVACGLLLAIGCAGVGAAQTPAPAQGPSLSPVWTLTGDFASPESVFYDQASNTLFVSSINGQILEKDGNGYISRLSPDGKVLNAKWVTGLNAPKGLRAAGGTLWAADIDQVVGVDIGSGRIVSRVPVDGAQFLNDLATSPDGTIYVSDSNLARIYMVKDGQASIFVEGGDLVEQPNGLLVEGSRLILGTVGPAPTGRRGAGRGDAGRGGGAGGRGQPPNGHLYAFDLKTKQRTQLTTDAVGGIDGIESDGSGGLLVTDVVGARLLHVTASGQVRVLATFAAGGADFGYIASRTLAVVPFLFSNTVSAFDLAGSLKEGPQPSR